MGIPTNLHSRLDRPTLKGSLNSKRLSQLLRITIYSFDDFKMPRTCPCCKINADGTCCCFSGDCECTCPCKSKSQCPCTASCSSCTQACNKNACECSDKATCCGANCQRSCCSR